MSVSANSSSAVSMMDYTEIPALIPDGVRGLIFDYGGTLDSHGDHWSHIILDGYRHAGISIGVGEFKEAYIHGERALGRPGAVAPTDNFLDLMRRKVEAETSILDPHPDPAVRESIARYCYDMARSCTAEAARTLDALAGSYPMALVSNFYGNLNSVLDDFGLSRYFRAVIESATAGVRKPDPLIFRLGIEALGLTPEETLVIGDSLDKDILSAASLGCRTLLIEGRPWPPVA